MIHADAVKVKSIFREDTTVWIIPTEPIGRTVIPPLFLSNGTDFVVTATGADSRPPPHDDLFKPFNGSINGTLEFNASDTVGPSLEVECTNTSYACMAFPSRLKIWSSRTHAPDSVLVSALFAGKDTWTEMFRNSMTDGSSDGGVHVLTLRQTLPTIIDTVFKNIRKFRIQFGTSDSAWLIHKVTFFRDVKLLSAVERRTNKDYGVCPSMSFTSSHTEDVTMTKMTRVLARLMDNTSCDDVFTNTSASSVSDASGGVTMESKVADHFKDNSTSTWKKATEGLTDAGKARFVANVRAEIQGEVQAYMSDETLRWSRGCGAMTAMATLMTNAQEDIACILNHLNTLSEVDGDTKTIKIVEFTSGEKITWKDFPAKMNISFTKNPNYLTAEVGRGLITIISTMLNSMTELTNGLSDVSQQTLLSAHKVSNDTVTHYLDLLTNVSIFIDSEYLDDTPATDHVIPCDILASVMVRKVVETYLGSADLKSTLETWRDENRADTQLNDDTEEVVLLNDDTEEVVLLNDDTEEVVLLNDDTEEVVLLNDDREEVVLLNDDREEVRRIDWMGLLLAPVLVVLAGGLVLFLGGPAVLLRRLTTTRSRVAVIGTVIVAALVGHILCLIYRHIGGAIACGMVLALGLYMMYRVTR